MFDRPTPEKVASLGGFGIALALVLSIIVSGGVSYSAGLHSVNNNETRTQYEDGAKGHTPSASAERQAISTIESIDVKIHSSEDAKYAQQDLAAQRQMAEWITNMGWAAFVGVFLSSIGIFLIYTTLRETRKAATSATKTYEAFVKVERAFLHPRVTDVRQWMDLDKNAGKIVDIYVTNIGKGSCVFHSIKWAWYDELPKFDDIDLHGPPRGELIETNSDSVIGFIKSNKPMSEREVFIAKIIYTHPLSLQTKQVGSFRKSTREWLRILNPKIGPKTHKTKSIPFRQARWKHESTAVNVRRTSRNTP